MVRKRLNVIWSKERIVEFLAEFFSLSWACRKGKSRACAHRRESHRKRGCLQLVLSMTRLLLMLPPGVKIGQEKNLFRPI